MYKTASVSARSSVQPPSPYGSLSLILEQPCPLTNMAPQTPLLEDTTESRQRHDLVRAPRAGDSEEC